MAKLPPIRRLVMQDFVTQSQWIGPLLQNLNNFMEAVYNSLNQALTLQDNSTGAIVSTTLTALPTSVAPVRVPWTKPAVPQAVLIGGIQQRNPAQSNVASQSGTVLTAAPGLEWQYLTTNSGNYIQITNLVGTPTPTTALTLVLQLVVLTD